MDDKHIYEKLREFRRSRGISVGELAKELGENSQKVGRIERGQRSLTVDYLLKISKTLSTPIETILEIDQPKKLKMESSSFHTNILNDLVILIDEICSNLPVESTSQQKAKMISKIYGAILKLPNENQQCFFNLLSESLKIILENNRK